jgi:hypothetical protein
MSLRFYGESASTKPSQKNASAQISSKDLFMNPVAHEEYSKKSFKAYRKAHPETDQNSSAADETLIKTMKDAYENIERAFYYDSVLLKVYDPDGLKGYDAGDFVIQENVCECHARFDFEILKDKNFKRTYIDVPVDCLAIPTKDPVRVYINSLFTSQGFNPLDEPIMMQLIREDHSLDGKVIENRESLPLAVGNYMHIPVKNMGLPNDYLRTGIKTLRPRIKETEHWQRVERTDTGAGTEAFYIEPLEFMPYIDPTAVYSTLDYVVPYNRSKDPTMVDFYTIAQGSPLYDVLQESKLIPNLLLVKLAHMGNNSFTKAAEDTKKERHELIVHMSVLILIFKHIQSGQYLDREIDKNTKLSVRLFLPEGGLFTPNMLPEPVWYQTVDPVTNKTKTIQMKPETQFWLSLQIAIIEPKMYRKMHACLSQMLVLRVEKYLSNKKKEEKAKPLEEKKPEPVEKEEEEPEDE